MSTKIQIKLISPIFKYLQTLGCYRVLRSFRDMVLAVIHEAEDWVSAGFLPLGEALVRWSHLSAPL